MSMQISSSICIVVVCSVSPRGVASTCFLRGCVGRVGFFLFLFGLILPPTPFHDLTSDLPYLLLIALACGSSSEGPMTSREVMSIKGPPGGTAASNRELPEILPLLL